jgi:hypothetical protein
MATAAGEILYSAGTNPHARRTRHSQPNPSTWIPSSDKNAVSPDRLLPEPFRARSRRVQDKDQQRHSVFLSIAELPRSRIGHSTPSSEAGRRQFTVSTPSVSNGLLEFSLGYLCVVPSLNSAHATADPNVRDSALGNVAWWGGLRGCPFYV